MPKKGFFTKNLHSDREDSPEHGVLHKAIHPSVAYGYEDSAAISSSAGSELAQLLSTIKEAYDARYRTGFSFSDLTANSVGVALAEFATRNDASALEFQRRIITLSDDSEYMPAVGNNRDGITEEAFSVRYRDRSSVEFAQRLREIQTMIAERPFFANQQWVDDWMLAEAQLKELFNLLSSKRRMLASQLSEFRDDLKPAALIKLC